MLRMPINDDAGSLSVGSGEEMGKLVEALRRASGISESSMSATEVGAVVKT